MSLGITPQIDENELTEFANSLGSGQQVNVSQISPQVTESPSLNENELTDFALSLDSKPVPETSPVRDPELATFGTGTGVRQKVDRLVSQFQRGVGEAVKGTGEFVGVPQVEPLAQPGEAKGVLEKSAKLAGNLLTPEVFGASTKLFKLAAKSNGTILKSEPAFISMKKIFDKGATAFNQVAKNRLADTFNLLAGVPEEATLLMLDKPGIFKRKFLNRKKISRENLDKSIGALQKSFKDVESIRERVAKPLLEKSTETVNIKALREELIDDLIENDIIIPIKKAKKLKLLKTKPKSFGDSQRLRNQLQGQKGFAANRDFKLFKGDLEPIKFTKIKTGSGANKELKDPLEDIINILQNSPDELSLVDADKIKRSINNKFFDRGLSKNKTIGNSFKNFRNDLTEKFPQEYKDVNKNFEALYSLRDEMRLGSKLDKNRVEGTLLNLFGKAKTVELDALKQLDDFLPENSKFLDSVLEELTVKAFGQIEPSNIFKVFRLGGVGASAGAVGGPLASLAGGLSLGALSSPRLLSTTIRGPQAIARGLRKIPTSVKKGGAKIGLREVIKNNEGLTSQERKF